MNGNNNNGDRKLQPLAPAGTASLYLIHLSNTNSGIDEAGPLHLLIGGLQEIAPAPVPTKLIELPQTLQQYLNGSGQMTSQSDQISHQVMTKPKENEQLNMVSLSHERRLQLNSSSSLETTSYISNRNEIHETNITVNKRHEKIQNSVHILDRVVPSRAIAALPTSLQLRRDCVSPRRSLPPWVRFGPVQGLRTKIIPTQAEELIFDAAVRKCPIFLVKRNEESVEHIDVSDKDNSNWFSLLPLGDTNTANVWLYEEESELYGMTTESLPVRTPLTLGYSKTYAENHKLPPGVPVLDLEEADKVKRWWCFECLYAAPSAGLLQRHMNVCHKDDEPPRRKYRCSVCSRTFSRLFTLRRHKARFCAKKAETPPIVTDNSESHSNTSPEPCMQNTQDSRIPSDESFQNYTNGLDFPTNLFDTDRIPNLDISGSSKSDVDFNPYSLGLKLDSNIEDPVCEKKKPVNESKSKSVKNEDIILTTCGYCKQTISKAKKRRHLRECPARRYECECHQKFTKKDALTRHIYSEHIASPSNSENKQQITNQPNVTNQPNDSSKEKQYKCEDCKLSFKRRGMLINHLWRIHNMVSASVPLERSVRHYPCSACPKIYRTAVKRNLHELKYHPGVETVRVAPIEGERRLCEPSSCTACPRQYVTRAKLLQHMRAAHPHMVELQSSKTRAKKTPKNNHIVKSSTR